MKISLLIILSLVSLYSWSQSKTEIQNWQEDLNFYAQTLPNKHIDIFHTISKKVFLSELDKLKHSLPTLTRNQTLVEFMRLTYKVGDGHTSFPLWGAELTNFPIQLRRLHKRWYVIKTTNQFRHLLGAQLTKINDVSIEEVFRLFSQITPFSENQYSTQVRAAQYITKAELLNGLGIINDSLNARFSFKRSTDKNEIELTLSPQRSYSLNAQLSYQNNGLFLAKEKIDENIWFGASKDKNIIYVKFRRYTSTSKMESLAEDLLAFINKNKSEKLIIDLRDNYGGDFFVGLKLTQFLVLADSIDWKSGVYTLIDNVTFSAAMSNAAQFSQLLNAKIVGEPTGSKPSGYQDMGQFILPNSNLEVTYSKRLYHFDAKQKDALYPDVNIEISIDDYLTSNDSQLQWILKDIEKKLTKI